MDKVHVVSLRRLDVALGRVTRELDQHGFWDRATATVDVCLVPLGAAYGWKWTGEGGHIAIPAVSALRVRDWFGGSYVALADVLRHEYGHAVADTHRGLIRSRRFSTVFGASYDDDSSFEYDPRFHVTEYASTGTAEAFAETFMLYLKHGGRIPGRPGSGPIRRQWAFVRALAQAVRDGRRRW